MIKLARYVRQLRILLPHSQVGKPLVNSRNFRSALSFASGDGRGECMCSVLFLHRDDPCTRIAKSDYLKLSKPPFEQPIAELQLFEIICWRTIGVTYCIDSTLRQERLVSSRLVAAEYLEYYAIPEDLSKCLLFEDVELMSPCF